MASINVGKRLIHKTLFSLGLELRRIKPSDLGSPVYSYGDEEAVIQDLLGKIKSKHKFAVDIGAGDGEYMSNSYKLFNSGWHGVAVEWNGRQFAKLAYRYSDLPDVCLLRARVTPDNVLSLLASCDAPKEFAYLGLDIDSYDHFVLERVLTAYRPSLICSEINEKIPPPLRFTVKWQSDGDWSKDHFYGQSLSMLEQLAKRNNYDLVALEYNNAFLIPRELNPLPALAAAEAWRKGYVERSDRFQRFPWNKDMESLITMPTEQCLSVLREKFKPYEGKFILE
jgi:hypothetical protein